jgi:hypothetical protein
VKVSVHSDNQPANDIVLYPLCIRQQPLVCDVVDRLNLDRRRLEAAHLKYAILNISNRFKIPTSGSDHVVIETDIYNTLKEFTPIYYKAFTQKYGGICIAILTDILKLCEIFQ